MTVQTRQEQKAMFARFQKGNLREQHKKELGELETKFPKERFFKEDQRVSDLREKIRGQPLNLGTIIRLAKEDPNSFQSKDTAWLFTPKAYQITDIPNGIEWKEFPLTTVKAKFFRSPSGEIISKIDADVDLYVVNNTRVDPELLKDIAKFAKKKGLLEKGTLEELQEKGIFDAVSGGNIVNEGDRVRPISIKLGDNTFLLAPFIGGGETPE
jgi:hypothetical protein